MTGRNLHAASGTMVTHQNACRGRGGDVGIDYGSPDGLQPATYCVGQHSSGRADHHA